VTSEDVLSSLCQENLEYCRHHERQRQAVTGFAIVVASALAVFTLSDKQLNAWDVTVAFIIVVVGVFGAIMSAKHYERFDHHYERFRELRAALVARVDDLDIRTLNAQADARSEERSPYLSRWSLSRFWLGIHVVIIVVGLTLLVAALVCGLCGLCLPAH
jgi:Ca2+/Na+ antiporter